MRRVLCLARACAALLLLLTLLEERGALVDGLVLTYLGVNGQLWEFDSGARVLVDPILHGDLTFFGRPGLYSARAHGLAPHVGDADTADNDGGGATPLIAAGGTTTATSLADQVCGSGRIDAVRPTTLACFLRRPADERHKLSIPRFPAPLAGLRRPADERDTNSSIPRFPARSHARASIVIIVST